MRDRPHFQVHQKVGTTHLRNYENAIHTGKKASNEHPLHDEWIRDPTYRRQVDWSILYTNSIDSYYIHHIIQATYVMAENSRADNKFHPRWMNFFKVNHNRVECPLPAKKKSRLPTTGQVFKKKTAKSHLSLLDSSSTFTLGEKNGQLLRRWAK